VWNGSPTSDCWLIPDPGRNLAQVTIVDAAGRRLFSYFSP
jgi:hypothetical protein